MMPPENFSQDLSVLGTIGCIALAVLTFAFLMPIISGLFFYCMQSGYKCADLIFRKRP